MNTTKSRHFPELALFSRWPEPARLAALLAAIILIFSVGEGRLAPGAEPAGRPNVLLILADDK